jgi:hypothetical protein
MIVLYPTGNAIQVSVGNKCGNTTAIDILSFPHHGFQGRRGRSRLMKQGVYFRNENLAPGTTKILANVAIIRDPVKRLASCYADRVLRKNRNNSREFAPTWDYFVKNLEEVRNKSADVKSHSRPQVAWTGNDTSKFTHIILTDNITKEFTPLVSKISGVNIPATSHRKSSRGLSSKVELEITQEHIEIIKDFYKDDYEVWGNYFQ